MAAFRAAESAKGAGRRLLDDPYASSLLPAGLRAMARVAAWPAIGPALTGLVDLRWPGARTSGIARTRLIDDWLSQATDGGKMQIVLVGAGFDCRAWRLPALAAATIFELDHPATSAAKLSRLASLGADLGRVRFVAIDFDRESVADCLRDAAFDAERRTIVLWEGVSNYLQPEAVDAVMRWAGSLAPASRFIFTYVDAGLFDGTVPFAGAASVMRAVRHSGEPWTFGLDPETVVDYLSLRGLRLLTDLGADEYRVEVMGPSARRLRGYGFYHAVSAEVAGA